VVRKRIFGVLATALVAAIWMGAAAGASSAKTVWLCKPGQQPDPCTPGLSTTVYTPTFVQAAVQHPKRVSHPAIDCFYVYPTVSNDPGVNAPLAIEPEMKFCALFLLIGLNSRLLYRLLFRRRTESGCWLPAQSPLRQLAFTSCVS